MLGKTHRLKRVSFKGARARRFTSSALLSLRIYSSEGDVSKVSFVVPKKVIKSAVKRNQIKRKGYVAIRPYIGKLKRPSNLVFSFKKEALGASGEKISASIRKNLIEMGLLL